MSDSDSLSRFGYPQELRRTLTLAAGIGIAFCDISPVVGVYTLFGYCLATGGPSFIWGLPIVLGGQLLVALTFCELAVVYPIAGSLYQWARRLVGPRYGWFVGWIYGWALIITLAAVDLGAAPLMATVLGVEATRHNLAGLGALVVVGHTIFNSAGLRGTIAVTMVGVSIEVAATLVLGGALLFGPGSLQPLSVLFSRQTATGTVDGAAFLAAILALAWIFYGFESAADVAEEVVDAGRRVPRAMVLALLSSAAVTVFLLVALILATPDISRAAADPALTVPYILSAHFGPLLSRALVILLVLAYFSCGGAVQVAAARLVFSYARDGMLPASAWLRQVSPGRRVPANAIYFCAAAALLVIAASSIDLGAVNITALVASYAVIGMYLSYQSVVIGRLIAAGRGWTSDAPPGHFSLGRWSVPVASAALAYGAAMVVNLCWPRPVGSLTGWLTLFAALGIVVPGALIVALKDRLRLESQLEAT